MSAESVRLEAGTRMLFEGDPVTVIAFDGRRVTLRWDGAHRVQSVSIATVAAGVRELASMGDRRDGLAQRLAWVSAPDAEREAAAQRAAHLREVLTGFRCGDPAQAAPGEPRPEYAPGVPLMSRYASKAAELGVSARSVARWVGAFRNGGVEQLVDERAAQGLRTGVDPPWDAAVEAVVAETVGESTGTRSALLRRVRARLDRNYGQGEVPLPSKATAYRRIAMLTKGTNAVSGSAKGRRSIAQRPSGPYGRLVASRPGEYVVLDTQDLDVFAMEEGTGRWVGAQLTIAQDLMTRGICGLRGTLVSTKAVDVAGVLFETVAAPLVTQGAASSGSPARHPLSLYHGVPEHLVFSELAAETTWSCPPETIVVDHGKVYLSEHVIGGCDRLGISVQPAVPFKPTDKPTCERFFRTLRESLIQHLPGYKGPDVFSRGADSEGQAFFFLHELEDVIRDWVGGCYHEQTHSGLSIPAFPGEDLCPREMLEIGAATAGGLRIPRDPTLVFEFLQVRWRTIQHYGVQVDGPRYDGAVLEGYRNTVSPYGGRASGKWPLRVNPDDVRHVFFQDPQDNTWHALEWEHARLIGAPFSAEAAAYARRFAGVENRHADPEEALTSLLARWSTGEVADRRERRIAARLAAERTALPQLAPPVAVDDQDAEREAVPDRAAALSLVSDLVMGDDDEDGEILAELPVEPAGRAERGSRRTFEVIF